MGKPRRLPRGGCHFAHHEGTYIRLAHADDLAGPWTVHTSGVLDLSESRFEDHVASPDVHVRDGERTIRMYYHGVEDGDQVTRVATSPDGLAFDERRPPLGKYYFRVFEWKGDWYAVARGGTVYRSDDPLSPFARKGTLAPDVRHCAAQVRGDVLYLFYSRVGDSPERILASRIPYDLDPASWTVTGTETVVWPRERYEGADRPVAPSRRGAATGRVCQLRDPVVYEEDGRTYLLYSVPGERGIAIGRLAEE